MVRCSSTRDPEVSKKPSLLQSGLVSQPGSWSLPGVLQHVQNGIVLGSNVGALKLRAWPHHLRATDVVSCHVLPPSHLCRKMYWHGTQHLGHWPPQKSSNSCTNLLLKCCLIVVAVQQNAGDKRTTSTSRCGEPRSCAMLRPWPPSWNDPRKNRGMAFKK